MTLLQSGLEKLAKLYILPSLLISAPKIIMFRLKTLNFAKHSYSIRGTQHKVVKKSHAVESLLALDLWSAFQIAKWCTFPKRALWKRLYCRGNTKQIAQYRFPNMKKNSSNRFCSFIMVWKKCDYINGLLHEPTLLVNLYQWNSHRVLVPKTVECLQLGRCGLSCKLKKYFLHELLLTNIFTQEDSKECVKNENFAKRDVPIYKVNCFPCFP